MAVEVKMAWKAALSKPLFQAQLIPASVWRNRYVASLDGQRFLMLVPTNQVKPVPIIVVVMSRKLAQMSLSCLPPKHLLTSPS